MTANSLTIYPLLLEAEVLPGDDLAALLIPVLQAYKPLKQSDVLIVAQKIVSKSEGRFVDLNEVTPGKLASELAATTGKDPRLVEVILSESTEVVRAVKGVLIVRHRSGLVMANAGIDRSNVPQEQGVERVLLLPVDADQSAANIRMTIERLCGVKVGVIISDSFGRPWRMGVTNVAIGSAGIAALLDQRGDLDRQGRNLLVTQIANGDALAAAAGLVMGEGAQGIPAALIRGWRSQGMNLSAQRLIRPVEDDLFR